MHFGFSIRQKLFVIAALPVLAGLASGGVLRKALAQSQEDAAWVKHTLEVLTHAQVLTEAVLEAQTAARAYLLTGDSTFAAPYGPASERFTREYATLRNLVADNPPQEVRLSGIGELFDRWRARDGAPSLAVAPSTTGAQRLALARSMTAQLDEFRSGANEFVATEQALLVGRETRSRDAIRLTVVAEGTMAAAIAVASLLALLLGLQISRAANTLAAAAAAFARGDLLATAELQGDDELGQTATAFNQMARQLANRKRGEERMKTFREALQSAISPDEAVEIFERLSPALLGVRAGDLYLSRNSRNGLFLAGHFGQAERPASMTFDDCWALRNSRPYWVDGSEGSICCAHLSEEKKASVCLPLHAQAEVRGMVVLSLEPQDLSTDSRSLELEFAEVLGMALANLQLREMLRNQAIRDPLTGLYNRRYLEETLDRELSRAKRSRQPLALLMLDVDHFKRFNDDHGHAAGDVVLKELGRLLLDAFRGSDIACRLGGEEFVVVLPGVGASEAQQRAERIRHDVKMMSLRLEQTVLGPVSVSLGVAVNVGQELSGRELLRSADAALYISKREGRDRVTLAKAG